MSSPSQFSADTLRFISYLDKTEAGFPASITTLEEMGDSFENGITFNNHRDVYNIPSNVTKCTALLKFLNVLYKAFKDGISYGIYENLDKISEHLKHIQIHSYLCDKYIKSQSQQSCFA